jgi:thiamine pyrophosphokinase
VGDLDSASPETLVHFKHIPLHRDPDTERTDTEKAVAFTLERGPFARVTIFGASQGRLDHVLGHLGLLRKYHTRARLELVDAHGRAYLARKEARLDLPPGTVVSFFAVGDHAEGVTTENLRFALHDKTLAMGAQESISNVVERSPAFIRIRSGEILIVEVTNP